MGGWLLGGGGGGGGGRRSECTRGATGEGLERGRIQKK